MGAANGHTLVAGADYFNFAMLKEPGRGVEHMNGSNDRVIGPMLSDTFTFPRGAEIIGQADHPFTS